MNPGARREGSAAIADVRGARKVALEKSEDSRGSAASQGETPPATHPTPPRRLPVPPASRRQSPAGLLRGGGGRSGARTGDRGATSGIQISGWGLDVDFNESGLHVDLVVPVIASCWQREGQRAGLGSRRPKRPDRGRKDRPTSPSWVSGALRPVPRSALAPPRLPPRPPPRRPGPERLGSAAAGESPRGVGHFRGPERGARACAS